MNVARALLFQSRVPVRFWGECILTACHLINRTPSPVLSWQTFFRLYKKDADYTGLRVFGSLCFASTLASNRSKFHPRATPSVFIGYPQGIKGFKLYDIETKRFFVSRDVVFHEDIFPFHNVLNKDEVPDLFPDLVLPRFSTYGGLPLVDSITSQGVSNIPSTGVTEQQANSQATDASASDIPPAEVFPTTSQVEVPTALPSASQPTGSPKSTA